MAWSSLSRSWLDLLTDAPDVHSAQIFIILRYRAQENEKLSAARHLLPHKRDKRDKHMTVRKHLRNAIAPCLLLCFNPKINREAGWVISDSNSKSLSTSLTDTFKPVLQANNWFMSPSSCYLKISSQLPLLCFSYSAASHVAMRLLASREQKRPTQHMKTCMRGRCTLFYRQNCFKTG